MPTLLYAMVDGTHVGVQPKGNENPESYRNRHHTKSINVMLVTLPSGKIAYVKADMTGRINDSRVFHNSRLYKKGTRNYQSCKKMLILVLIHTSF